MESFLIMLVTIVNRRLLRFAFEVRRVPYCLRFFNCITDHLGDYNNEFGCFALDHAKELCPYVADVEMQKLDHLIANLGNVYTFIMTGAMPFRRRFYRLKERCTR
jgi:hypothetical protein